VTLVDTNVILDLVTNDPDWSGWSIGNNDDAAVNGCDGWENIQPYAEVSVDGVHLVLCHYPFRSWRNMSKGWVNLHGHSHGRLKPLLRQFDVGVEVWNFRPVRLTEVLGSRKAGTPKPI
jgi:calcineurin-like phosphoesterase family protein